MVNGDLNGNSTFFIDEHGDTLDFDALPVYIDCLFLPGSAKQLRLLLPQINFYNLNAVLLGSDGWGDESVYRLGESVTKRAVFPSPFLEGELSEENLRFAAAYDARYGTQPRRLARLGYDAIRLATSAISEGGNTREQMTERLALTSEYNGAAGRVTFGPSRENVAMPLYQLQGETPVYLGVGGLSADDLSGDGP